MFMKNFVIKMGRHQEGAARYGRVKQFKTNLAVVALCLSVIALCAVFNSQISYAVSYNGEPLATVKTISQAEDLIDDVENQVSDILGYDCAMDDYFSVSAELWTKNSPDVNLDQVILNNVDGIVSAWAVVVDGEVVGAVYNQEEIAQVLDTFLAEAADSGATTVSYAQSVSLRSMLVQEKMVYTPEELAALLRPGSGSKYSLTIRSQFLTQHTEALPYETRQIEDDTMYAGKSQVITAGQPGEILITNYKTYMDGVLSGSGELSSIVTTEPTAEVIAIGTMPLPPTASTGSYIWPVSGRMISSYFGPRSVSVGSSNHKGIDIPGDFAQEIQAADGGEVIFAGWASGYGNFVQIQHDNGDVTCYGHCTALLVEVGEKVYQGQPIALMGSTGNSTGVHLHFEVRIGGNQVNPLDYLPES